MSSQKNKKMTTFLILLLGVGVLLYFMYKDKDFISNPPQVIVEKPAETPIEVVPIVPEVPQVKPSYHILSTTSSTPGAELIAEVGFENVEFTLALNRLDAKHIPVEAVLIIPDTFEDLSIYAPFPKEINDAQNIPKLFIVSQRIQAFGAYEYGKLVRWGTVSTGKKETQTPSRLYSTNWKGKLVTSTLEGAYLLPWAFNLESDEGISMHQFDLPGYPASHACVRLSEKDAMWFYEWAEQWILTPDGNTRIAHGTPVIVFGEYGYGKTAPWKKLPDNLDATTISPDELNKVVSEYLLEIKSRLEERNKVLGII